MSIWRIALVFEICNVVSAFVLPVSPALGVDDSSVCQWHQELARLIFDVDEIVDQQCDLLANVLALQAVNGHSLLRHDVIVSYMSLEFKFVQPFLDYVKDTFVRQNIRATNTTADLQKYHPNLAPSPPERRAISSARMSHALDSPSTASPLSPRGDPMKSPRALAISLSERP